MRWIVLANLVVSTFMTGVIWFVQIVHYPLFAHVGRESFVAFETEHANRTGWIVAPPMIFEVIASIALAYVTWGTAFAAFGAAGLLLVIVIWVSTFALQVRCHNRLHLGYEAEVQQRLVRSNWIRTLAWSARTVLLVVLLACISR